MSRKLGYGLSIAFAGALFATAASADPINLDQWYAVNFFEAGGALNGNCGCANSTDPTSLNAPVGPWTFTSGSPVTLIVVDSQASGDRFDISDFTTDLGQTSLPPVVGDFSCAQDIGCLLTNSNYSQGVYALGAGDHSISGVVTAFDGPGNAYFEVVSSAVPEPATLALLGAGLVGFGTLRRRKARKS